VPGLDVRERVRLGVYNGMMMAYTLKDYNKIAIVSQIGPQCLSTSSSLIATFTEITRGIAEFFPLTKEGLMLTIENLIDFNPQATIVIVGGEERLEECQALLRKFLDALAEKAFKGDLVVCLRGYLAGCIRDLARANIEILSYMELMKYLKGWSILTHDVDLGNKRFVLGRINVVDGNVVFEEIASYPMYADHLDLLRKIMD
jgi:hypothetical protein